jgi:outer membrane protein OmpA-like peptidoglycan-associated protein
VLSIFFATKSTKIIIKELKEFFMKSKTISVLTITISLLLFISFSFGEDSLSDRSILHGVSFKSGSAVLLESSDQALDPLLSELKTKPALKLTIEGYTDSTGSYRNNLELSQRRAQAIADWLAVRGIEHSRLKVVGYGSSRPIADNSTSRGRERNRRIEIVRVESQAPAAVLPARGYEFEPVPDGVEVRHDFVLQNKGTAPLIISRVKTG